MKISNERIVEDNKTIDNMLQNDNENVTETQQTEEPLEETVSNKPTNDNKGNVLNRKNKTEILKDSKLKDDKGNVLLVYHGTDNKFDKFTS